MSHIERSGPMFLEPFLPIGDKIELGKRGEAAAIPEEIANPEVRYKFPAMEGLAVTSTPGKEI